MPGMKNTMGEYKAGTLHSGSKTGPVVKSRAQAIAIGLSEQRKVGHNSMNDYMPKHKGGHEGLKPEHLKQGFSRPTKPGADMQTPSHESAPGGKVKAGEPDLLHGNPFPHGEPC